MEAVILAAGIGARLRRLGHKTLLYFAGTSLLERHITLLLSCGITQITIVTGHHYRQIAKHLSVIPGRHRVSLVVNLDYRQGSIISLLCAGATIRRQQKPFLLMDGDVLYDQRLLRRLIFAPAPNTLLFDRYFIDGEDPVKIVLQRQSESWHIADFHKKITIDKADYIGESVGFFKLTPSMGLFLLERATYYRQHQPFLWYEETIHDAIHQFPAQFGVADISGIPWLEIDYPNDIIRAERHIMPRLNPLIRNRSQWPRLL